MEIIISIPGVIRRETIFNPSLLAYWGKKTNKCEHFTIFYGVEQASKLMSEVPKIS